MINIKIDGILKSKNKTRYWLAKETSMTYPNLVNLCRGTTNSIKFELIEKICLILDCNITDIIEIVPDITDNKK